MVYDAKFQLIRNIILSKIVVFGELEKLKNCIFEKMTDIIIQGFNKNNTEMVKNYKLSFFEFNIYFELCLFLINLKCIQYKKG